MAPEDYPRFAVDTKLLSDWPGFFSAAKKAFPDVDIEAATKEAHFYLETSGRKYRNMRQFLRNQFARKQGTASVGKARRRETEDRGARVRNVEETRAYLGRFRGTPGEGMTKEEYLQLGLKPMTLAELQRCDENEPWPESETEPF